MPRTVIYLSSCAIHENGKPDPFLLQELPWLTSHFDRALMVSYYGVATLTPEGVDFPLAKIGFALLRSWIETPFCREFWHEVRHLSKDRRLTPVNFLKLFKFRQRGLKMHHWTEKLLKGCKDTQTTLYSCWMSFDGYAAALSKEKHPKARFVVRGHAFDIDVERNPMNPYLMKRYISAQANGIYLISQIAKKQYMEYMAGVVDRSKVLVLAMGSGGEPVKSCKRASLFAQGILRVVSCAMIAPIKQLPVLVDALSQWEGVPLHWTHIGSGDSMAAFQRLVESKLDSKSNIIYELLGSLDSAEVEQVYEKRPFDVFINTSMKEGVPVSVMEAIRHGILVIAPNVGGIPELVTPEVGFLYEPSEGAAGVLKRLNELAALSEPATQRMREAAWKRWNAHYCSAALLPPLFPEAVKKGA